MCVCCHPIYSGRQACGRSSRGHTGFLHFPSAVLALIFLAIPFPRRPCSRIFVCKRINRSLLVEHLFCLLLYVCVCVFFPSILDIKFVGRTSRGHTGGRSDRIFNPPSFCGACLGFCREKDSAIPFSRRP